MDKIFVFFQTILITPFILLLLLITALIPDTIDTDITNYNTYRQELNYASEFMPELSELGQFEALRFGYKETPQFIFLPKTMSLTVKYSEAEFASVKDKMLARYEFIDAPIIDTDGDVLLDDSFTHQGYVFHSVPMLKAMHSACEYFGLLGVNDKQCCIAWLYYDDVERDFIAESGEDLDDAMRGLIDEEFCWKPPVE